MEASGSFAGVQKGVDRLVEKARVSLEQGNYYEAHQLYKTLSHRYVGQKKYDDAIEVMYNGACTFIDKNQFQSGFDLALSMLDVLKKLEPSSKLQHISKIADIHSKIPVSVRERELFVVKALNCTKTSTAITGPPELHKALAHNLWNEKLHSQAFYHFLYASDGENCGKFLVEFHHQFGGRPCEVDLFVAQMVLQLLCLKNTTTANLTFYTYVNNHPDVSQGPPFILPLLNFLWFLLLAINDGKLAVFTVLCEKYQPSIERDPVYKQYLDKIGQSYFGLPAPNTESGFLGSLMRSLISGLAEDSSDEELSERPTPSQPARNPVFDSNDVD